jgi:hypothetical protein
MDQQQLLLVQVARVWQSQLLDHLFITQVAAVEQLILLELEEPEVMVAAGQDQAHQVERELLERQIKAAGVEDQILFPTLNQAQMVGPVL